jgi:hypothetical protein
VPQIAAPVEEKVNVVEQPIVSKTTTNIPYNTFVQNNLKSLHSRQDWVRNNADYLRAKGWSDADIAGYKGQGNLNLRLASQLGGLEAWKKKQAEELALAKQQDIPVAKLEAPIQPVEPVLAETVLNHIPSTLLQPRTVEEARLQKMRELA